MSEFRENRNLVCGINDQAMKTAILNCYNTAEELRKEFCKIENIMLNLRDFYVCSGSSDFFQSFENFKDNFAIAASNVEMYGDDLTKVRNNFRQITESSAEIIKFNK